MEMVEGGKFLGIGRYQDGRGETYYSPSCNNGAGGSGYIAHKSFKIFGITINQWDELVCLAGEM